MQTVLLLHGALGAAEQLAPLKQLLAGHYEVHTLSFEGHGGCPMPDGPFAIPLFAKNVLAYITQHNLGQVHVFGYSMGGYVAMYLAKHYPDKISKIITLATKFHWDEAVASREVKMLDPQQTAAKVPAFAEVLKARHAPNSWETVMGKTAEMLTGLGHDNPLKPGDYAGISLPCLLLLGDRDKMISLEETVETFKSLPNAEMGMLPGTPHMIEKVNPQVLAGFIERFIG